MKRTVKFRGRDMSGHWNYGLLTKKKIRSSGEVVWAIATGDCSASRTVPVKEDSIAQFVGYDANGNEVYEGDIVVGRDYEVVAGLCSNPILKNFKLKEAPVETHD